MFCSAALRICLKQGGCRKGPLPLAECNNGHASLKRQDCESSSSKLHEKQHKSHHTGGCGVRCAACHANGKGACMRTTDTGHRERRAALRMPRAPVAQYRSPRMKATSATLQRALNGQCTPPDCQ